MARLLDRLGRAAFRRRWLVLIIWLLALAGVGAGMAASGMQMKDVFTIPGTEAGQAQALVEERFGAAVAGSGNNPGAAAEDTSLPGASRIVIQAEPGTFTSPTGLAPVLGALGPVGQAADVASVSDPIQQQAIAPDGSVLYIDVRFDVPSADVPAATVDTIRDVAATLEKGGATVALAGGPFAPGLHLLSGTEAVGVVVALLVLIVTFGSLLAAGMPILTALIGVGVGVGGVLSLSAAVEISSATLLLGLMLGLAVGIDYALFLLSRHRQQLAEGMDAQTSAGRAVGTAGSAVVFAGLTVVIALVGLTVTGIPFLAAMGLAAAFTVLVSVLVAITLLPALMGFLGDRLRPRGRAARKAQAAANAENRWGRFVTGKPVIAFVAGVILLGVLALPGASMRLGLPDAGHAPADTGERQAYDMIAKGFGPGMNGPLVVALDGDKSDPAPMFAEAAQLAEKIGALDGVAYVSAPIPNGTPDPTTGMPTADGADAVMVMVLPSGGPNDEVTADVVHEIRALRGADGDAIEGGTVPFYVTGSTAANIDITQKLSDALPVFLVIVVGLALVLLLIAFRSVLVPVTAVIGFLGTVFATFGATTAVYQWGWLKGVFNVASPGPLISFLPIILVGILFGLAMDYQVFLVSRMREEHVHAADGEPPITAVRLGFAHGARVVTAAALIMISVFVSFVFSGSEMIAPIAFALGFGVLVDAFVVRMTLIPAVMALLGRSAWWLPRWLDRIVPKVDIEGEGLAPVEPAEPVLEPAR